MGLRQPSKEDRTENRFHSSMRQLSLLADGHDEHMALVRMSDAESFDKIEFRECLQRPLTQQKRSSLNHANRTRWFEKPLRFLLNCRYLYDKAKAFETPGSYAHLMMRLDKDLASPSTCHWPSACFAEAAAAERAVAGARAWRGEESRRA